MNNKYLFHDTNIFLSSLSPKIIKKVYGDINIQHIAENNFSSISELLIEVFGDYIIEIELNSNRIFISSSACSLSFVYKDEIFSEEQMLSSEGYSSKYLEDIDDLSISYAPKSQMFSEDVFVLFPSTILVTNDKNFVQKNSWLDILLGRPQDFSIHKMKRSLKKYFSDKKVYLLTSGGVDTALLLDIFNDKDDICYVTYNFERTGGNNTPNDAKRLLENMLKNKSYKHFIFHTDNLHSLKEKIYEQDVDLDLMKRLKLENKGVFVVSGQNSDSIVAPGFVKSDSFLSLFRNWGFKIGLKSIFVNTMLVMFGSSVTRTIFKFLLKPLDIFLRVYSNKILDYSIKGFYIGLFDSVPFIYSKKTINKKILESYDQINSLFMNGLKNDRSSLTLLRFYSYSLYAMQNQRGVNTEGYRYILPFHSAHFIGYCLNRNFNLNNIWNPKKSIIDYLISNGMKKSFLFYGKDRETNDLKG